MSSFDKQRQALLSALLDQGVCSQEVADAMMKIPREEFLPAGERDNAYHDTALPIGSKQTISQPTVIATMTESLMPLAGKRVLEIGTGSGYQAAILSYLADDVYTLERIEELYTQAIERFVQLELNNIHTHHADGYDGWQDAAPFDAIIVTAAAEEVPQSLLEQLKVGGRMIIPVNTPLGNYQELLLMTKTEDGLEEKSLMDVVFVPMLKGIE